MGERDNQSSLSAPLKLGFSLTKPSALVIRMRHVLAWDRVFAGALPFLLCQPEALGGVQMSPILRERDQVTRNQEAAGVEDDALESWPCCCYSFVRVQK